MISHNPPYYKITVKETKQEITKCSACLEEFQLIGKGHEEDFTVEVLQ